jgi:hypothetical protein
MLSRDFAGEALRRHKPEPAFADDVPPPNGIEDYNTSQTPALPSIALPEGLPLTTSEWLDRDLPAPDCLLGSWLTTTSRILVVGGTGLG